MGRFLTATALLSLPFSVAHEFTHFAVAQLITRQAEMAVTVYRDVEFFISDEISDVDSSDENRQSSGDADPTPGGIAVWPPIDSKPLRAFAHLSPTVFGTALMGLWAWNNPSLGGWRLVFALGLAFYTVPSPADVRGALGVQQSQQKTTDDDRSKSQKCTYHEEDC